MKEMFYQSGKFGSNTYEWTTLGHIKSVMHDLVGSSGFQMGNNSKKDVFIYFLAKYWKTHCTVLRNEYDTKNRQHVLLI